MSAGTLPEAATCGTLVEHEPLLRIEDLAVSFSRAGSDRARAVDGVSLTVSGLGDDWLEVNVIPTTMQETSLGDRRVGDEVNLEGDLLGKYVARLLGRERSGGVTEQVLAENGFL